MHLKKLFFFVNFILIVFSLFCSERKLPNKIAKRLETHKVLDECAIVGINQKGCSSCNSSIFKFVSELSKENLDRIFYLIDDSLSLQSLEFFLKFQSLSANKDKIIVDKEVYDYFSKKTKTENYVIAFKDGAYSSLDESNLNKTTINNFFNQNKTQETRIKFVDTTSFNLTFPTPYNTYKYKGEELFVLNQHSNNLYIFNTKTNSISILSADSIVDKMAILKRLDLNDRDYALTLSENINAKVLSDRFINLTNVNFSGEKIYFTCTVKYLHRLNKEELDSFRAKLKKTKLTQQLTSNDTLIETLKTQLFIFQFDRNSSEIKYYLLKGCPDDYIVDPLSGSFFEEKEKEATLAIKYFGEYVNQENFVSKNFACAKFKLDEKSQTLNFIGKMNAIRPKWFSRKGVLTNFANGNFLLDSTKNIFYLNSYPYFIDLDKGTTYEVPATELKNINQVNGNKFLSKNEPGYLFVGVYDCSRDIRSLLAYSINNGALLSFNFDRNGSFLSCNKVLENKGVPVCANNNLFYIEQDKISKQKKYLIKAQLTLSK